jgi:hypothetical protein
VLIAIPMYLFLLFLGLWTILGQLFVVGPIKDLVSMEEVAEVIQELRRKAIREKFEEMEVVK